MNSEESVAATRATRISERDLERLQRLARETQQTQQEILSRALDSYEREHLLDAMNAGFAALRADPVAWREELAERKSWDATSSDTGADG